MFPIHITFILQGLLLRLFSSTRKVTLYSKHPLDSLPVWTWIWCMTNQGQPLPSTSQSNWRVMSEFLSCWFWLIVSMPFSFSNACLLVKISLFLILYHIMSLCSEASLTNYLQFHRRAPYWLSMAFSLVFIPVIVALPVVNCLDHWPFLACAYNIFRISSQLCDD